MIVFDSIKKNSYSIMHHDTVLTQTTKCFQTNGQHTPADDVVLGSNKRDVEIEDVHSHIVTHSRNATTTRIFVLTSCLSLSMYVTPSLVFRELSQFF